MKLKSILVTLLFCTIALAACAPSVPVEEEPSIESPTSVSGALSTVASTQSSEEVPELMAVQPEKDKGLDGDDGRVIVYTRSGGIAGVSEEWIIFEDGTVIDADGVKQQVDPKQVQAIIDIAGDMSLKGSYAPLDNCCDLFTYTVTIYTDGVTKSVTTVDGAKQPEEVTAIFNGLGQLLTELQQ